MDFNPEICYNLLKQDLDYAGSDFLTSDMQISDAKKLWLLNSLFKKWEPLDSSSLETVALDSFQRSNNSCAQVILPDRASYLYDIMETAKSLMYQYFYSAPFQSSVLTLNACLHFSKAGPGASCGTRHTDFYHKMFCGPLTMTNDGLYSHYSNGLSEHWRAAEKIRYARFGLTIVEGSNLSTVPKNRDTNRTICTEPSLNMFYQLGAGTVITQLLEKYHNIDLSLQPGVNQSMALEGSLSGKFATIDLSNASDTISLALVKYILPPDVFNVLDFIRSKNTRISGKYVPLNMMSTMGNGFTFPLQTLIFATLVRATYMHTGITPSTRTFRNYSVFGDDIICTKHAYNTVVEVLEGCGFSVNREKSFNVGSFRESCGSDYFRGADIRGVYLRKIQNEADIFSTFNRLLRWSVRHNIDITSVLLYVKGLVKFQPVPFTAGDAEGFKCPAATVTCGKTDRNGARYYRATVTVGRIQRVRETDVDYNPFANIICAIGGYIREQRVTLRSSNKPTLKVVKRKTPSWDYVDDPGLTIRDYEYAWITLRLHESDNAARVENNRLAQANV